MLKSPVIAIAWGKIPIIVGQAALFGDEAMMIPLFDMMMTADNGKLLETMSSQMGLAQEQSAKALAALMPAFSAGLKRSASDPYNFTAILSSLGSGNYAKYFEDMNRAFTPQGIADGNKLVNQIFGSNAIAEAISAQASQAAGVGQEMMNNMMPAIASALAGGIFKQMTGQMQPFADAADNPMLETMNVWMKAAGFQPKPAARQPNPFDNPFTQAMSQMFGGQQASKAEADSDPFGTGAFMKMMQGMMTGKSTPDPEPDPKAVDLSKYTEIFTSMIDSGLEVQKSYQKSVESILDSQMKSMGGKTSE